MTCRNPLASSPGRAAAPARRSSEPSPPASARRIGIVSAPANRRRPSRGLFDTTMLPAPSLVIITEREDDGWNDGRSGVVSGQSPSRHRAVSPPGPCFVRRTSRKERRRRPDSDPIARKMALRHASPDGRRCIGADGTVAFPGGGRRSRGRRRETGRRRAGSPWAGRAEAGGERKNHDDSEPAGRRGSPAART